MSSCSKIRIARYCNGKDVKTVQLKSHSNPNQYLGEIAQMCAECRKSNNGEFKIMATKKTTNHAAGAVSLKVLAERKEVEGVSKATHFLVDPRLIKMEDGFNGRPIYPEHVASIQGAMEAGAQFDPLTVTVEDGEITVRDGHHRLTAMLNLIEKGMSILRTACIEFKSTDRAERIALMIGSGMGLGLTPLQLGVQYKELINPCGWTVKEIATRFGKSSQHVADMILLANSNSDVQGMVTRGEVKATTALKVVKAERGGAGKVLSAALDDAKAKGRKSVTPKNVMSDATLASRGGDKYVTEIKARALQAKTHLVAMLDSPTMSEGDRDAIGKVLQRIKVTPIQASPLDDKPVLGDMSAVREWLGKTRKTDPNHRVTEAATLLYAVATNQPFPALPSAKTSVVLACMQDYIAAETTRPALREAMRFSYMHLARDNAETRALKPPTILPLVDAIQAEIDSEGAARAEIMCPEYAELITYLRGSK